MLYCTENYKKGHESKQVSNEGGGYYTLLNRQSAQNREGNAIQKFVKMYNKKA